MKSIAFINQKGGVGKTTSVINIGAGLAQLGKRILLIDFDPQASLTYSLGIPADDLDKTIYELLNTPKHLMSRGYIQDFIISIKLSDTHHFDLLPTSIALSGLEVSLASNQQKNFALKEILDHINDFDYVLIDCPPTLGLLTVNVLAAVQEVYVPVQTEFLALQGLKHIASTLQVVTQSINPGLKLGGIFGTKYNRRKLHNDTMQCLKSFFPNKVFKTVIRENISLGEAPSFGMDIFRHSPTSIGAQDYKHLCDEIIKLEGIV